MRGILLALASCLTATVALAQGAKNPAKVDTANLTFRWPETVTARVEAHRYRVRQTNGKQDTSNAGMSYRMTATRSGQEYVIRFDDFQVAGMEAVPRTPEKVALDERMGGFVPSYRVSASGEFVRLESSAAIRAFLDSIMTVWTSKESPPPPQVKQLITAMTSDAVLEARAAEEWNALVGAWIGAALEVGEVYGTEGEEPIAFFQNAMVKYEYEFSALRRMPCDSVAAPAARDCVELQMVSRPDSAAMRQLMQRLVGDIAGDSTGEIGFLDFNIENVVTLVARPESLLPVHLTVTKQVTGSARAEGKTETMYQLEVKTQKYTYSRMRNKE
ncbi:MAG TPA: hypothetical protein VJ650_11230 [Gemmatimonadaceae bacterium]|nr:hypothetical protein [Gemmatimonadaceae bacterium]